VVIIIIIITEHSILW